MFNVYHVIIINNNNKQICIVPQGRNFRGAEKGDFLANCIPTENTPSESISEDRKIVLRVDKSKRVSTRWTVRAVTNRK